jgi:hypothetical protein
MRVIALWGGKEVMEKQKEVKVSKMVIQLSDESISLSISDAKKLYEALAELFGKKIVEHEHHYPNDYWWYRPYKYEPYYMGAIGGGLMMLGSNQKMLNAGNLQLETANFTSKADTLYCDLSKSAVS